LRTTNKCLNTQKTKNKWIKEIKINISWSHTNKKIQKVFTFLCSKTLKKVIFAQDACWTGAAWSGLKVGVRFFLPWTIGTKDNTTSTRETDNCVQNENLSIFSLIKGILTSRPAQPLQTALQREFSRR
jgi:hypothetical protein